MTRLLLALVAIISVGCATTQQVALQPGGQSTYCPFMGAALCAKLESTGEPSRFSSGAPDSTRVLLRYVDSTAQWSKYNSVMIQPVTFWADDDSKISPKEQHDLTNFFYQTLEKQFAAKYTVVADPAPGVMRVQVAIDDADSATPVLRTISMVIPQARALATLKFLATGTYPFVGSVQAEAKITDSMTGVVLVAGVDRRVGGGALRTAAQWQLGDAENAIGAWSKQMADRLSEWTSGAAKP